jgi:hypothetical protein
VIKLIVEGPGPVEMPRRDAATVGLAALLLLPEEVEQWGLVYWRPRPRRREQEQAAPRVPRHRRACLLSPGRPPRRRQPAVPRPAVASVSRLPTTPRHATFCSFHTAIIAPRFLLPFFLMVLVKLISLYYLFLAVMVRPHATSADLTPSSAFMRIVVFPLRHHYALMTARA